MKFAFLSLSSDYSCGLAAILPRPVVGLSSSEPAALAGWAAAAASATTTESSCAAPECGVGIIDRAASPGEPPPRPGSCEKIFHSLFSKLRVCDALRVRDIEECALLRRRSRCAVRAA